MPPSHLRAICFDCTDHHRVARFWAEVLGYAIHPSDAAAADEFVALMPAEGGLHLSFNRVPESKVVKNRVHLDINMPDGAELQRLRRLGARVLQEIHDEAGRLKWTILADPEGNEFCAFPPTAS